VTSANSGNGRAELLGDGVEGWFCILALQPQQLGRSELLGEAAVPS